MKNLKFVFIISLLFVSPLWANTQAITDLAQIPMPTKLDNIKVIPLGSSDSASEYLIFIKDKVKAHYHEKHTELVYILAGTADFWLGDSKHSVKAGDFIRINQGIIHQVKVTSEQPLKVLSIQTPKFDGKDRIFVE